MCGISKVKFFWPEEIKAVKLPAATWLSYWPAYPPLALSVGHSHWILSQNSLPVDDRYRPGKFGEDHLYGMDLAIPSNHTHTATLYNNRYLLTSVALVFGFWLSTVNVACVGLLGIQFPPGMICMRIWSSDMVCWMVL